MDTGFATPTLTDDLTGRLRRVADQGNVTSALPNEAYLDPSFENAEREAIWRNGWIAIGFEGDVPRKGSMMPVDIAGLPLVMVRGRDDQIRVFHNVCRHRGLKLVTEPGRTGSVIRCPYHAWCYRLDGALDKTPHVGGVGINAHEAVDADSLGLLPVRAAIWFGVVFADPSGVAPDMDEAFGEIADRWIEFKGADFIAGGDDSTFDLTVNCNWKLAVENYLESYHLPSVHPLLNSYSRIEDHLLVRGDNGNAGQVSLVYNPALDREGRGFPRVEGLSDYWTTRAEYIAVYPNLLYGIHADHWYAIVLIPLSGGKTREHVRIGYFTQEAATGPDYLDLREANTKLWRSVFEEDIEPVQRMQEGRHSPAFDGGVLTPVLETTTRDFHAWTAARLLR